MTHLKMWLKKPCMTTCEIRLLSTNIEITYNFHCREISFCSIWRYKLVNEIAKSSILMNCKTVEKKLTFKFSYCFLNWNQITITLEKSTQQITQETPLQLKSTIRIILPSTFFEIVQMSCYWSFEYAKYEKNDWFAGSVISKVHR